MRRIDSRSIKALAVAALAFLVLLPALSAQARSIDARSVILMNFDTGFIHYEQDADEPIAPASLTKVLTMYLVMEAVRDGHVRLTDLVTVSVRASDTGGSSMHLEAGETVALEELMKGMAVSSGNDACVAVAEYMAGNEAEFVRWMNLKAQALGMANSHFENPHGLPADGQITTARDMLTLATAYIRDFPEALADYHSMTEYTHNGETRRNSNKLLGVCEGVDGLKTGYVASSRCNIIATGQRDGHRIIAVIMGADNSEIRLEETSFIMEAGFRAGPRTRYVAEAVTGGGSGATSGASGGASAADSSRIERSAAGSNALDVSRSTQTSASGLGQYCIQESSWDDQAKAQARVAELTAQGLEARIASVNLGDRGTWYRVLLGAFSNRGDAEAFLNQIAGRHNLDHAIVIINS